MSVQNYTREGEAPSSTFPRPRLTREGILLGGELVPLLSGSVHYFRLEPASWRDCLQALRAMGCRMVDVYVPWSVHEKSDGSFDFGERDPQLDVKAFLRMAQQLGLYALLRPGPHINAELTGFGLPERVIWDPECQARSPAGEPVILPMPPLAFPVPSYASRKLLAQASAWLERIAAHLGELAWPAGPIVLCQIDNEGALYFRDGVYEQDYHPDSVSAYRAALAERYGTPERLSEQYGSPLNDFNVEPPARFDAKDFGGLLRQLDWAEHQEALIANAFAVFRDALLRSGLERLPTCHNLPMGESATPLDPARLGKVVECLGMDYYHVASESSADAILRRTSEVTTRADAFDYPAFAIELAAGFPPFFPALTQDDNRFAALSCLAAGIRGFNLYMAVERDRWIGSPIDRFGARRPFFDFWQRLNHAVERTRLFELSRVADVCVVVPRSMHRLERLLHAFGPLSAAAFDLMGLVAYDSCLEQGPFASSLFEAEKYLRTLLGELAEQGIAFRIASSEAAAHALERARLAFLLSAVGLEPEVWEAARGALGAGRQLCLAPKLPTATPNGRNQLPPLTEQERGSCLRIELEELPARLRELAREHEVFRLDSVPGIRCSLFRDNTGVARVLFVTNASSHARVARVTGAGESDASDALDGTIFRASVGALEVPLLPHSVRMLELH